MRKKEEKYKSSEFEKRWQRRFRQYASLSDDDAGIAGWSPTGLSTRFSYFVSHWCHGPGNQTWLDAGCGAGTYTRHLYSKGCAVIGLDYSFETVAKAKARCPNELGWVVGNAKMLPIRTQMLDGAICFGVTQALSDSETLIYELLRVVKPGGQIWIDALNARCIPHLVKILYWRIRSRPAHLRYESPANMRRLFEQQGMSNVKLYWVPVLPQRLHAYSFLVNHPVIRWLFMRTPLLGALLSHSILISGTKNSGHGE